MPKYVCFVFCLFVVGVVLLLFFLFFGGGNLFQDGVIKQIEDNG